MPPRIQNTANIAGAAGAITAIAAGSANPVGFIVGPIIAGAVFAKWVYDIYRATYVCFYLILCLKTF